MGFAEAFTYTSAEEIFEEIRGFSNPATGYDLRGVDLRPPARRAAAVADRAGRSGAQPDPLPQRR